MTEILSSGTRFFECEIPLFSGKKCGHRIEEQQYTDFANVGEGEQYPTETVEFNRRQAEAHYYALIEAHENTHHITAGGC